MPMRQIDNVGRAFGSPFPELSSQVLIEVVNNSGVTLKQGDVVIVDATGRLATTSTTAATPLVLGVVSRTGDAATDGVTIAASAVMWVAVGGVARVNIGGNTVAVGGVMAQTATAKVADDTATAIGTGFAIALEANTATDANSTIRCIIDKV